MIYYREDLNGAFCEKITCTHRDHEVAKPVYLNSACHPLEGVTATYYAGYVHLQCKTCGKSIIEVAVASRPEGVILR